MRFGTYHLPSTGEEIGPFGSVFRKWLNAMLDLESPDFVYFEAPILPKQTTPMTARKLMGLAWEVETACYDREAPRHPIPCREVAGATIKKFLTGSGWAKKHDMVAAARRYGFAVTDDNQADAIAIFGDACKKLHPKVSTVFDLGALGQVAR